MSNQIATRKLARKLDTNVRVLFAAYRARVAFKLLKKENQIRNKAEYTLEWYRWRFCNWPNMFECEQKCGQFSKGRTTSESFDKCPNFLPILKKIANQRTERKIASESNLHHQINFQENSRQFKIFPATCNKRSYLFWNNKKRIFSIIFSNNICKNQAR